MNICVCADDSIVETLRSLEALGIGKYHEYKKEVVTDRMMSIHDAIKKTSLALFRSLKQKVKSKSSQQLTVQRNNTSLFGRLYILPINTAQFFSHENQTTPPSWSDFGKIWLGQKSVLNMFRLQQSTFASSF